MPLTTIFSRSLALVVCLEIMFRGNRDVQTHLRDMVPDVSDLRRMVCIGPLASIEITGRTLSTNSLLVIVARFPNTGAAAYGIGTRILSVAFLPVFAIARSVETMTGQNLRVDKPNRDDDAAGGVAKAPFGDLTVAEFGGFLVPEPIVSASLDANQALDSLSGIVDVARLQVFAEATESSTIGRVQRSMTMHMISIPDILLDQLVIILSTVLNSDGQLSQRITKFRKHTARRYVTGRYGG